MFKPLDEHFQTFVDEYLSDVDKAVSIRDITHLYTSELQRFIREHADAFNSAIVANTTRAHTTKD